MSGPCAVQLCMRAAHCPAELMAPFAASWAAACTRLHAAPTFWTSPHTFPRARFYKYRTRVLTGAATPTRTAADNGLQMLPRHYGTCTRKKERPTAAPPAAQAR